jgi:hypothetical protein
VLVDPAAPEDIARGLLSVLSAQEAWHYYHRAGIERVMSRYTWGRTAEGYLAALNQALAEPSRAGNLPIPAYFSEPGPENRIDISELTRLYFAV